MDQNKAIKFLYNLSYKLNKFYKSNSKKKLIINNKSKRKEKFNPVTNFDKSFEKMIRAYIVKSFPKDGIIGEEFKVALGVVKLFKFGAETAFIKLLFLVTKLF